LKSGISLKNCITLLKDFGLVLVVVGWYWFHYKFCVWKKCVLAETEAFQEPEYSSDIRRQYRR